MHSTSNRHLPSVASSAASTTRLTRLRTPSKYNRLGVRLLGESASLPVLTMPWAGAARPETAPLRRPMTPSMQQELASLVFMPKEVKAKLAARAHEEARVRAARKAKFAAGPKVLRISGISCEDLPDADKGIGGGTSDPFVEFELITDRGDRFTARTRTLWNAPRTHARFRDVLELPCPMALLQGKCNATLIVKVWDDDSVDDGLEGVNSNDLMGQSAIRFHCRNCPYKIEGHVDRATFDGVGALYAFRVSFRYDAVPEPPKAPKEDPLLPSFSGPGV